MVALLITIASSGARRTFPGRKTAFAAVGLTGVTAFGLVVLGSAAGWIALLLGLFANGLAYASIRSHRCPRDGSWLMIDQEVIDEPTYWISGLARVVERCTSSACGYRRQYDKELPRKQRTVYIGGGGGGGGWGGGGGGWGGGGGGGVGGGGGGGLGGGGGGRRRRRVGRGRRWRFGRRRRGPRRLGAVIPRQVLEAGELVEEGGVGGPDRAVALLADDHLGDALYVLLFPLVDLFTIQENYSVRVLLQRAGLA